MKATEATARAALQHPAARRPTLDFGRSRCSPSVGARRAAALLRVHGRFEPRHRSEGARASKAASGEPPSLDPALAPGRRAFLTSETSDTERATSSRDASEQGERDSTWDGAPRLTCSDIATALSGVGSPIRGAPHSHTNTPIERSVPASGRCSRAVLAGTRVRQRQHLDRRRIRRRRPRGQPLTEHGGGRRRGP